jgi:hypothetical protein
MSHSATPCAARHVIMARCVIARSFSNFGTRDSSFEPDPARMDRVE